MSSPRRLRWHNVAATIVWGLLWRCTEVVGTTTTAPKDPLEEQCPASTAAPVNPYGYRPPSGKSAALVTELLHPFSLQTFVDDFWEKRPLVVRGRCALLLCRLKNISTNLSAQSTLSSQFAAFEAAKFSLHLTVRREITIPSPCHHVTIWQHIFRRYIITDRKKNAVGIQDVMDVRRLRHSDEFREEKHTLV